MAKTPVIKKVETAETRIERINNTLSLVFHIIWIIVGLFILLVVLQGFRQGAYSNLLSFKTQSAPTGAPEVTQPPWDVNLEGIGKVNVACAKGALPDASIQKLIESKDINSLTADERTKFQPCIVEATPSASPK